MSRSSTPVSTTIVIPTMARPSLDLLLEALAEQSVPVTAPIVLVDDRPGDPPELVPAVSGLDVTVVRSGGGGPARARNIGWRHARTPWVSFLDDDVLPGPDWWLALLDDLAVATGSGATGTIARLRVPLPRDRRPTDWERGTAGLETAHWITADLSYRREAVAAVGGFDERFRRAFREDADLALRLGARLDDDDRGRGAVIMRGSRSISHPVRPADDWASVRQQAGNADDVLMRRLHGPGWHELAGAAVGRRPRHLATTAAGALALASGVARVATRSRRARRGLRAVSRVSALGWLAGTTEFAWHRIEPGPRDAAEVRRMLLTSAAIPPTATWHTLRGLARHRDVPPWRGLPELVLLDRDGTLVEDVPYNGDPALVRPLPGVRETLDRLRGEGIRLVVVSNQSGIGRGRLSEEQVRAVNDRVEELLGPFEGWYVCPHAPQDACACRKPAPGLVKQALADTGVPPERAVLIGDIGADVEAALAAGVTPYLVPTTETLLEEVTAAPRVARSLSAAVDCVFEGEW